MKSEKEILEALKKSVVDADEKLLMQAIDAAVQAEIDPVKAIKEGLSPAMREVGEKMERGEVFLSQVMLSAETMRRGIEIFIAKIPSERKREAVIGTVVIGTVQGDIHDIGKNMVASMLTAAGFRVYDLGKDVPISKFIEEAQRVDADVIAISALMTVTSPFMRDIIKVLQDLGVRRRYKVIVGGGPVTKEYAEEIGADGYGTDMVEAVKLAEKLIKKE